MKSNPLNVLGTINPDNRPTVGKSANDKSLIKRMKKTAVFNNKTIKHFKAS